MKIQRLIYRDQITKINIEVADFEKFTLLVGKSGVGKTQILETIRTFKRIVEGDTQGLDGVSWEVDFEIGSKIYNWAGKFKADEFSNKASKYIDFEKTNQQLPVITIEKLSINGIEIVSRKNSLVQFKGVKTPKISLNKSFLSIYSEESEIKPIFEGLKKINYLNYEDERRYLLPHKRIQDYTNSNKYQNISDVIKLHAPIIMKLAIIYNCFKDEFTKISKRFIDIFPDVVDIKFDIDKDEEVYLLWIKEKGTLWIPQYDFSSGMYKSLMLISELLLLEEGSIIVTDELENSLGVNCIDDVVDLILNSNRNVQFIVTSHHPYIINTVELSKWRIVTREKTNIRVINTSNANIGDSKHDSFKQLMNSPYFRG